MEALLRDYDDDPVGALGTAISILLGRPEAGWAELLDAAPLPPDRRAALLAGDQAAADALVIELNELRAFRPTPAQPVSPGRPITG